MAAYDTAISAGTKEQAEAIWFAGGDQSVVDSNDINYNIGDGVYCKEGGNPVFNWNNFCDNDGYGINNVDPSITVMAENNWWDDNSGPFHPILNQFGKGEEVSDYVDFDPWTIIVNLDNNDNRATVTEYALHQNYPNPFNPLTTITYGVPVNSHITLTVYNALGKEVATLVSQEQVAGIYQIVFNAINLASGVYFYSLQVGDFVETKKMILMK